ncbi:LOW QUALITY PROTEIN: ribosyldihydronicotinamide dehydrogenase [quinone]-like [Spinachia spinachia]
MAKVLIVYAHQSSESFNSAAKDAAKDVLEAQGCTVEVSDLYAMKFKATATAEDVTGTSVPPGTKRLALIEYRDRMRCFVWPGDVKNAAHFRYAEETELAWQEGKLCADITEEQGKLTEADLVVFQFPMYWFTVPAILKGWMDRVLTLGYAYSDERRYSQGMFKDKKAMLSFTTGSHESMFGADGVNGDMNVTLWPLQAEWRPALLWLPGSGPSDLLGSLSSSL